MGEYTSTRKASDLSVSEAIVKGIADDGGLFVLKDISKKHLAINEILSLNYKQLAKRVFAIFFDDFSKEEIAECVDKAYTGSFDTDEVVVLTKNGHLHELELYHGPTYAFKDVALQFLPWSMRTAMHKQGLKEKILILTATSGDTGKAALEGFKDVDDILINVFYPDAGVSAIQERQMTTTDGHNTFVTALKGNFDDCQRLVKELFADDDFKNELLAKGIRFSSANSINISRLIPQVVYYFYAYKKMIEEQAIGMGEEVSFCVPTGNFGDILAGYYAKLLGLPVAKFICASNSNDVLDEFIRTGTYDRRREFYKTIAPSMDILVSSNVERLLYELYDHDHCRVAKLMDQLNSEGHYSLDDVQLRKLQDSFVSFKVNDNDIRQQIKEEFDINHRLIDTHTAVAYAAAKHFDLRNTIILSTASAYKFAGSVLKAIDPEAITDDEFETINKLYAISKVMIPANIAKLKELPVRHSCCITEEEARERIRAITGDKNA